jgi:hypothetical protein
MIPKLHSLYANRGRSRARRAQQLMHTQPAKGEEKRERIKLNVEMENEGEKRGAEGSLREVEFDQRALQEKCQYPEFSVDTEKWFIAETIEGVHGAVYCHRATGRPLVLVRILSASGVADDFAYFLFQQTTLGDGSVDQQMFHCTEATKLAPLYLQWAHEIYCEKLGPLAEDDYECYTRERREMCDKIGLPLATEVEYTTTSSATPEQRRVVKAKRSESTTQEVMAVEETGGIITTQL